MLLSRQTFGFPYSMHTQPVQNKRAGNVQNLTVCVGMVSIGKLVGTMVQEKWHF